MISHIHTRVQYHVIYGNLPGVVLPLAIDPGLEDACWNLLRLYF